MKQSVERTKLGPVGRLLKTAQQWTQGASARSKKGPGNRCAPDSEKAKCWCLFGAVWKCYPQICRWGVLYHLGTTLGTPVSRWNDKRGRKFSQVRKLLEDTGV
jgi:hypothetical protein